MFVQPLKIPDSSRPACPLRAFRTAASCDVPPTTPPSVFVHNLWLKSNVGTHDECRHNLESYALYFNWYLDHESYTPAVLFEAKKNMATSKELRKKANLRCAQCSRISFQKKLMGKKSELRFLDARPEHRKKNKLQNSCETKPLCTYKY